METTAEKTGTSVAEEKPRSTAEADLTKYKVYCDREFLLNIKADKVHRLLLILCIRL